MKDRIRKVMESQHMTQQVFAQFIEMSPASLSSIFNGRTKPTLNILEAIKKKIPDISTDWLMFGSGPMYNTSGPVESTAPKLPSEPSFSSSQVRSPMLNFEPSSTPTPEIAPQASPSVIGVKSTRPEIVREEIKFVDKPPRRVIEIRVFYDDQTWDTFVPAKK